MRLQYFYHSTEKAIPDNKSPRRTKNNIPIINIYDTSINLFSNILYYSNYTIIN